MNSRPLFKQKRILGDLHGQVIVLCCTYAQINFKKIDFVGLSMLVKSKIFEF